MTRRRNFMRSFANKMKACLPCIHPGADGDPQRGRRRQNLYFSETSQQVTDDSANAEFPGFPVLESRSDFPGFPILATTRPVHKYPLFGLQNSVPNGPDTSVINEMEVAVEILNSESTQIDFPISEFQTLAVDGSDDPVQVDESGDEIVETSESVHGPSRMLKCPDTFDEGLDMLNGLLQPFYMKLEKDVNGTPAAELLPINILNYSHHSSGSYYITFADSNGIIYAKRRSSDNNTIDSQNVEITSVKKWEGNSHPFFGPAEEIMQINGRVRHNRKQEGGISCMMMDKGKEMQALKELVSVKPSFPHHFTLFCNRPSCDTFLSLMSRVAPCAGPNNLNRIQPDYDSTNDTDANPCETLTGPNPDSAPVEPVTFTSTNDGSESGNKSHKKLSGIRSETEPSSVSDLSTNPAGNGIKSETASDLSGGDLPTAIDKNQAAEENNTLKEKVEAVNKTATKLTSVGPDSTKMPPEPKMTVPDSEPTGMVSEVSAVQNHGYESEVVIDHSMSNTYKTESETLNENSEIINEIETDSTEGIHKPEMTKLPGLKLKAPIREDEKITDSSSSKNHDIDADYKTVFDEIGEIVTPIFSFFKKSIRFLPISEPDKQLPMQVFGEETDDGA